MHLLCKYKLEGPCGSASFLPSKPVPEHGAFDLAGYLEPALGVWGSGWAFVGGKWCLVLRSSLEPLDSRLECALLGSCHLRQGGLPEDPGEALGHPRDLDGRSLSPPPSLPHQRWAMLALFGKQGGE